MDQEGANIIIPRHYSTFFSHNDSKYHSILLAVRHIVELHHTALTIASLFTEVLYEWEIAPERVWFVVTDNGSNIVKVFKEDYTSEAMDTFQQHSQFTIFPTQLADFKPIKSEHSHDPTTFFPARSKKKTSIAEALSDLFIKTDRQLA